MNMFDLSIDELIGQRFIIGVNSDNIDIILKLVREKHLGGVILYKKNYKTYEEMITVINKMKDANKDNKIPLFVAIDQEGGVVNRLPIEIHGMRNIYTVTKNDREDVSEYASIISQILSNVGVNMNFSPVVDIYNNSKSKALINRCFYGDVDDVIELALKYVKEFEKRNVLSVVKHYPGHGATKMDSHLFVPYVSNYKDILNKHIVPFNTLSKKGIDAIMVGHILVRKLCGILPASLDNKFVNKYLRHDNSFEGLIISDEINMIKHNFIYRFIYADKILKSFNDMILIKINNEKEVDKIIAKYKKILKEPEYKEYLDKFVERIIMIKEKYNISDKYSDGKIDLDKINDRIDKLNQKNETLL